MLITAVSLLTVGINVLYRFRCF